MATPSQLAEKLRQDRDGAPVSRASTTGPPPLPPRENTTPAPPPYDADDARRSQLISEQWRSADPRSSSTHSLVPTEAGRDNHDGRRTLLLIFIHGFMGNELSFQEFPAHVHNFLSIALEETHVVHTKIYPRYKSRKDISFARDGFSEWRAGAPRKSLHRRRTFRPLNGFRVLLTTEPDSELHLAKCLLPNDPFFNPPFPNDVRLPDRKGWTNILHFINKHSDGLTSATKQYFMSHLEFGGCLADYPGLKNRYEKIRALEDVDELARENGPGHGPPTRRIRFTNYYTASTGRPKAPKSPEIPEGHLMDTDGNIRSIEVEMHDMTLEPAAGGSHGLASTPSISVEEHQDGATTPQQLGGDSESSPMEAQMKSLGQNSGVQNDVQEDEPQMEMRHIDSIPMEDDEEIGGAPLVSTETAAETESEPISEVQTTASEPPLPPIPAMPIEPESIDLSVYTDKDSRKVAEKEQKRVMKVYQQAVKDRESAIKDRQKLVEKRERKVRQDREKQLKAEEKQRQKEEREAEKQRLKEEKEEEKRKATINPEPRDRQASAASSIKDDKPKRDKKFCMLPPEYGGKRDKCWIRVYMEGVDEVGAHCGLFFPGPQYESLVGDVGARIEKWVHEDATKRAVLEAEGNR
ncbi:hypothetical protein D0Z07_5462 [Hyphodiscus hymeniophilus]|uniref:DUF676 domain-containing protein n=1 Tax=Hyphodiscus hymeniophilus TaxID=353542 RepID=A0A9P6VIS2_9HELO|nr:hypothetical protein D0Z07_5462 [Hyphodiscus hymeniophilus]